MRCWIPWMIIAVLVCSPSYATLEEAVATPEYESLSTLNEVAQKFVEEQLVGQVTGRLEITPGRLDPRLKLVKCKTPLQPFLPPGNQAMNTHTVGVLCESSPSWTVFLPIRVEVYTPVLIAAQPLTAGTLLQTTHFIQAEKKMNQLNRGFFQNPTDLQGLQIKRAVQAGMVISPHDVVEPIVVKKGELVKIAAIKGSLTVSMNGVATQDGHRGDLISVKNVNSGRLVQAIVRGPNQVEVPLE